MLKITQQLLSHFQEDKPDFSIISAYIKAIIKKGNLSDANLLLDFFLEKPSNSYRIDLLLPLFGLGTVDHAQKLVESSFDGKDLKQNYPEIILHLLGYLDGQDARDVLLHNAFGLEDYYVNKNAILGLLHLDCTGLESIIRNQIEACYGKNLFNEFTPALVCKLEKRQTILDQLFQLGSTTASTDCNAGLVLAFALCGIEGRKLFLKVLWDEHWECYGGGTATDYWTFVGMQNLGITIADLYQIIKSTPDKATLPYKMKVLASMINCKLYDNIPPFKFVQTPNESFLDIYKALFSWETPNRSNNIIDLARKVGMKDKFYELESKLRLSMEIELLK